MTRPTYKQYLSIILILVIVGVLAILWQKPGQVGASIEDGQAYNATTTRNFNGTALGALTQLKTTGGTFGSLVIQGAAAGTVNFYNATTSNVNLRTGNKATSTLLIASFPNSTAAGTYVLDVAFSDGLLMEIIATAPTSTPTWK